MRWGGDYKADIQEKAEELAEELHGKEFYSLPKPIQTLVYTEASRRYWDERADWADIVRDAARERGIK